MFRLLFLLLVIIPVIELWILIEVGSEIGGFSCVLLVLATAILGGALVRLQGISALKRIHQRMQIGQPIVLELVDALMIPLAGLLLLFPGFVTDALGFLLLVPMFRRFVLILIGASLINKYQNRSSRGRRGESFSEDKVIDIDTTKD